MATDDKGPKGPRGPKNTTLGDKLAAELDRMKARSSRGKDSHGRIVAMPPSAEDLAGMVKKLTQGAGRITGYVLAIVQDVEGEEVSRLSASASMLRPLDALHTTRKLLDNILPNLVKASVSGPDGPTVTPSEFVAAVQQVYGDRPEFAAAMRAAVNDGPCPIHGDGPCPDGSDDFEGPKVGKGPNGTLLIFPRGNKLPEM
jgi:hypothetical protein